MTKAKRKPKNYLNNADMMIQIQQSLEQGQMTDEFVNMMRLLTNRYASQGNFAGYSYIEDMKAYALYMICRTWHRFDPKKSSNPFAFFTQCIKHSFYQFLNKEKRQRTIRDELMVNSGLNPSNSYLTDYEQAQREQRECDFSDYDELEYADETDVELEQ